MNSRNERRLSKKSLGKGVLDHPSVKRMRRNLKRAGRAALEVYRVNGDTPDQNIYFDAFSMRQWCDDNLHATATPMVWETAEQLVASGAVDRDHIKDHTVQASVRPIIVGRAVRGGNDQILDGAHTYVALAMAATAAGHGGEPVDVPAYLLDPGDWRRFVIPSRIAQALDFDATLDADERTWSAASGDWNQRIDG